MNDKIVEFIDKMDELLILNNELIESIDFTQDVSNHIYRDLITIKDILKTYVYKMNKDLY